ncbi:MAG TPA: tryptophan--tRNA ligase, partial [Trueperaceae bacterium]
MTETTLDQISAAPKAARETARKKRVFSGVQPSGDLHIGNYVGALRRWVETQQQTDNIFCVVDLHALTLPEQIDPKALHENSRKVAALYFACGINPDTNIVFIQSQVPQHTELAWLFNCITPLGWLQRMTQYKTKAQQFQSIGTGILVYPTLMAADILLYDTESVPVGEDQRQHVELTRDIAIRFNHLFGDTFTLPKATIPEVGARV